MKRIVLLITAILAIVSTSWAQDIITMKNGSVLRGKVTEEKSDQYVKMRDENGNVSVYKMEDIRRISREADDFLNLPENGYRGLVDFGLTAGLGQKGEDRIELATSHGYQYKRLFIGGGAGAHYYADSEKITVPLFGNLRYHLFPKKIITYIDARAGYSFIGYEGVYFAGSIGVRVPMRSSNRGFFVAAGFTYQEEKWESFRREGGSGGNVGIKATGTEKYPGINVRIGIDF